MRNFKRCLAMTLTVLMIVSCFSFVSVNAFDDVYDFEEAIDTLNGLGVIKGYDDTTFGPDDDVLRWHMALLVAKLVTGEVRTSVWESTANNTKFADVKPEHYYGSITWASGTGVIIGTSETTFEPEGKITFQDALTMVVRALGFGGEAMDKGYPWKYIQKGEDLGLTFGLEYIEDYETYLTRGETAQLLYNALYAENADGVTYAVDSFGLVEADVETVVLTGTNRFSMLSNEKVIKTGYVAFNPLNEDGSVNETLTYYIDKAAFGIEGNEDNYVGNVYDVYSTDGFASFVKVVEVAAEEAELVGNANNATNLVTINGTTYKVVESYSKLHATGEYQGNYPEIILYARDSAYAKTNASYVTDAYGNLLDAKGQVALYYMPHLVGFVNPYVTIDDAGVIKAATADDFAKAALVSAGDVHCYKKITNTLTEITNIGAVYDAEAVDVNGDGLYDRGMFVNYKYGAYGVDANGNLTIGSVATGRKANEIKYVDAEGNEIAAIGDGYYLYSYNAEGGILTIKEKLSVYSGYLSGLNTITNQLTIGGTVYNYGIKNLPAAEEANVEADITAALIGKNIQYVMYDGVVIDILAVANAGYVILDSVIGVTSTGLPTALVYNSTSNFATVIVVATLDTYSHYNFNFGTDTLNSVNSLLAAKAKGSVFTAQIDALGYYHLTTADSALQVNTGANNVIDFKNGISNSTAITGQITVNDNTVFLLYNDGKFTAIKGKPSNGAELVINAGAQYLTVSAGGVTSFIYVKGGSFSGTTQLPSWNNPANTTIVYIDNATSVATIVDNGLSSIIGVEGMTLLGYTYKYSAVLDVVNGKAIDVYSVSYNAQVKAGKFYSVVNGYIDREIDITAADSPIKLGYLGKLTETSGTFVANGTNALTSYDRENTVLVALDANGNVVRAANSMATFNYATDAATKGAINVDTKYLPVYYYVGTDIRPAANTFFAMDGVTALVNASDITIGEPTPEEIVIVPPEIAPGEGITGTLPNFAEVFEDAEVGDTVTLPEATLEKEGFTFAGWKINGVVYQAGAEFTIDVSTLSGNKIVIEPVWEEETVTPEPETYTVTYVGGEGATGEAPTQDAVEAGTKIVLANCTFTKENFTFAGWDIAGTVYLAGDEYTVTANTTITATWTENEQPGGDEPEPPVVEGAEMMQIFVEDNETLYGEKATKDVSVQFKGENINGVQAVIIAFDKTKVAPITTVDGAEELEQDYLLSDAIAMKDGYDYNGKFDSYADVEAYFYALPTAVKDGIVTVDEWAENGVAPVISYAEIGDTGYVYLMFKQNKIVNYAEWTTGITLRFAVLSGEVAPETIGVATTADANTLNASNSAHVATTVDGQQTLYIYVDGESDYATPLAKPATVVAEAEGGEDPEEPTTYTVTYDLGTVETESTQTLNETIWGAGSDGTVDGEKTYTDNATPVYCRGITVTDTETPAAVEIELYVSDASNLANDGATEYVSFQLCRAAEQGGNTSWNLKDVSFVDGWNTVRLDIADAAGITTAFDKMANIWFFAYTAGGANAAVPLTVSARNLKYIYSDAVEGEVPTQDAVEENATITLAAALELEGYTFKGWNDGTNTYEAGATYAVSKNTTLTAVWEKNAVEPEEPETYAVTYVGGEGAEGEAPTQDAVEAGTQITIADNTFAKEGFTFAGWSDGIATVQPGATYTVNAAVTFTAVWEQNAVEPEPPVVEGAEFMQIFVEDNETPYGEKETKDVSVQFKAENISGVQAVIIAFDKTKLAPITTVDGAEELGQDYLLTEAIAMKDGYDFDAKFDSYEDVEQYFYTLPAKERQGLTVVDEWVENGVAPVISYAEVGNTGFVYLMFKQNKIVNYAEWTTGITLRFAVLSGEVTADVIRVATTAEANALNASNSGHVALDVEGTQQLYVYYDDGTENSNPLAKPATVIDGAEAPVQTVSVTYVGGEGTTGTAPSQGAVAVGTEITLADNTFEKANHTFAGWKIGEAVLQPGDKYEVTADTTITAQWTAITYTVTFAGLDGITGEAPTQEPVTSGTVITLPAAPTKDGQLFSIWNIGAAGTFHAANSTYEVTGDVTFTACWNTPIFKTTDGDEVYWNVIDPQNPIGGGAAFTFYGFTGQPDASDNVNVDHVVTTEVGGKYGVVKAVETADTPVTITIHSLKAGLSKPSFAPQLDWYALLDGCDTTEDTYYVEVNVYVEDVDQIADDSLLTVNVHNTYAQPANVKWQTSVPKADLVDGWNTVYIPLTDEYFDGEAVTMEGTALPLVALNVNATMLRTAEVDLGVGSVRVTNTLPEIEEPEEPTTYTVTYVGGEGAEGEAPVQEAVASGTEITIKANTFTKEGFTFAGWQIGEAVLQPGDKYTVTANTTITATWEAIPKYTVTYKDYAETSTVLCGITQDDGLIGW